MTHEDIDRFLSGTHYVTHERGQWVAKPTPKLGRCGVCGVPIIEIEPDFGVGDAVVYDHINGSFGRQVGEGTIVASDGIQFLVEMKPGEFMWFHHCQLKRSL